ncbi:DUF177 domain-containing protein [Flavobacteriales bacterium]|nr:DUF177 domain-containing protein [Flavobacteriales bacterium]
MNEYRIIVGGIEEGIHSFTFDIKDSFFKAFSQSEVRHANIIVIVLLKKENNKLELSIQLNGKVNHLLCDICAEDISVDISSITKIMIKETSENLQSTDEIIYINSNENELSIEHLLFELITLSLPNRRQHPTNEDGTTNCNIEMISLIDKYNNIEEKLSDPRWDALKKLKIK